MQRWWCSGDDAAVIMQRWWCSCGNAAMMMQLWWCSDDDAAAVMMKCSIRWVRENSKTNQGFPPQGCLVHALMSIHLFNDVTLFAPLQFMYKHFKLFGYESGILLVIWRFMFIWRRMTVVIRYSKAMTSCETTLTPVTISSHMAMCERPGRWISASVEEVHTKQW